MSLENFNNFETELLKLVRNGKWKNVLRLSENYSKNEFNRFLWAWPTEDCLQILKKVLLKNRIKDVLSIGCGSGLLEWIINQSTGKILYIVHDQIS